MPESTFDALSRNKIRTGLAFVTSVLIAPSATSIFLFLPSSLTPLSIVIVVVALWGGTVPAALFLAPGFYLAARFSESRLAMVAAGAASGIAYILTRILICNSTHRPYLVRWLAGLGMAIDAKPEWVLRLGLSAVIGGLLSGLAFIAIAMPRGSVR